MQDRALLIRLGAIGDTLHATSAARFLARSFPEMKVDFLASPPGAALLPLVPEVDRAHVLASRRAPFSLNPAWRRLRPGMARQGYRLACLLETGPRFAPLLEGVRAERRIALGRDEQISGEAAAALPVPVRYQRFLAAAMGVQDDAGLPPRLVPRDQDRRRARRCLESLGVDPEARILGLHPGNSFRARKPGRRWLRRADSRSWPEEHWVRLILELHRLRPGAPVLLLGAAQDLPVNRRVARAARSADPGVLLFDAAGLTDLPTAAALLERFALFVSTDTGPLHMAAALGTPLIGLYGPTLFQQTRPFPVRPGTAVVLRRSLPCQPCYGTARQRSCRDNRCMRSIAVEEVLECAARCAGCGPGPISSPGDNC